MLLEDQRVYFLAVFLAAPVLLDVFLGLGKLVFLRFFDSIDNFLLLFFDLLARLLRVERILDGLLSVFDRFFNLTLEREATRVG
mmetsp:Transcript_38762/g.50752  ORF Transcript_38762/g.50752 Transcript_38762/m.50752 type:complete len:84 (-) Transcript_38762:255-506(-)